MTSTTASTYGAIVPDNILDDPDQLLAWLHGRDDILYPVKAAWAAKRRGDHIEAEQSWQNAYELVSFGWNRRRGEPSGTGASVGELALCLARHRMT